MADQAACLVAVAFFFVINLVVVPCSHGRAILEKKELNQGGTAVLPCHTSLSVNVDWSYTSERNPGEFPRVYTATGLVRKYSETGRYSVVEAGGWYNLTIKRVNISDSGEYICKENQGFGPPLSTRLSVRDIDECLSSSPVDGAVCSRHARCSNTIGSYFCTCLDGFEGDGHNCTDIDECEKNSKIKCAENALCHNTLGGYECSCPRGYVGVGNLSCTNVASLSPRRKTYVGQEIELLCHGLPSSASTVWWFLPSNVSEQMVIYSDNSVAIGYRDRVVFDGDPSNGDHSVWLTNMQPHDLGYYVCADATTMLKPVAFLVNVNDIDECEKKELNTCHQHATCYDTWESYSCTCKSGFRGNGHHCEDVDECAEGKHDCVDGANCENQIGRYACHCKARAIGLGNVSCIDLASIQPTEFWPLDAVSGDTVRLPCNRTDSNALHSWWYLGAAGDGVGVGKTSTPVNIYNGSTGACDTIVFNNRLSCNITNNNDLVLNNVSSSDAGIFVCAELTSQNVRIMQWIVLNVTVSYTEENDEAFRESLSSSSSPSTSSYWALLAVILFAGLLVAVIYLVIRRLTSRSGNDNSSNATIDIESNEEQRQCIQPDENVPRLVPIESDQTVYAVATCEDKVYWASRNKIYVYDRKESDGGKVCDAFSSKELGDIYIKSMAVCGATSSLYVSDGLKKHIRILDLTDRGNPSATPRDVIGMPSGMSVGSDRSLIVVVDVDDDIEMNTSVRDESENKRLINSPQRPNARVSTCRILEYSRGDKGLSESPSVIVPQAELTNVRHAVKIVGPSSDEDVFLVSHGGELNRVCEINREGLVLKCFGSEAGSSDEQLNDPRQLLTDARKRVYVADCANNKVKVLNSDLTFRSQYDIFRPTSLCLDGEKLYVGKSAH